MKLDFSVCKCGSTHPKLYYLGRLADCFLIDNEYVFPEQVEDILFKNGFFGDYKVIYNEEKYTIFTECEGYRDIHILTNEIKKLFHERNIQISLVPLGSLNYKGFGTRFENKK